MAYLQQIDYQPGLITGPDGPATRALAVTPDDGFPLPFVSRRLWIGSPGNVTLIPRDSTDPVTFQNVPVGMLNVWTRQVLATGTTASAIVALS